MNYWVFPKMQMIGKYGRLLKDWPSQCTLTKTRFVCVMIRTSGNDYDYIYCDRVLGFRSPYLEYSTHGAVGST